MNQWDYELFQEKLGNTIDVGVVNGNSLTGKTTVCKILNERLGTKVISMVDFAEKIKAKLGTEDEPFEGEVPLDTVQQEVQQYVIDTIQTTPGKAKFVFDGYLHKSS